MKRGIKLSLKIIGGVVATLLVLTVAAVFTLNTSWCQQKVLNYAVSLLEERLQTKVEIDSVSVSLWTQDIHLMGLRIEDRQERKMLEADHLAVSLDLTDLLDHKVDVSEAEITGVRMRLYQPKDSAANYQFVVDAFKSNKTDSTEQRQKEGGQSLAFDISQLTVKDVDIERQWVTKKGFQQTDNYSLAELRMAEKGGKQTVSIDSLRWKTDNHQPRKNAEKPHRGAFDTGHLDITANMELRVNYREKDTVNISLTRFEATDTLTGINVRDLHFTAGINKEKVYLSDVTIQHDSTVLTFDKGELTLPSKKQGRKLTYHTSEISGRTLLKDISRPFAPVLANFTIPLELKVKLSGTDTSMVFRDIHVNTVDNKLKLDADGGMEHFSPKEALNIHFHVKNMTTPTKTAIDIINQFAVKKFMMKQLKALGTINYTGDVQILYKKELFKGLLRTDVGSLNFNVTLDENTKYVLGQVNTSAIHLGKVLEMKDIGDVACNANFTFDMSKPRTAVMRKQKGGKLPIGQVNATVKEASYMKAKVKDVKVKIVSDGAVANGHLEKDNKNIDVLCDFTFTSTDSIHKMKIKPNLKFHNLPWQKKDKGDAKSKEQKKAEKAERKAQKKAEKARKKEEKAQKKAEKANK